MSSLSALNVDLVYKRTEGSAHPKGSIGHGNKERNAKEHPFSSLRDKDVTYSPAAKRIQSILKVELSVKLNAKFSSSTSGQTANSHTNTESDSLSGRDFGLHTAFQATEKAASLAAREQLAAKLQLDLEGSFGVGAVDDATSSDQSDTVSELDVDEIIENVSSVVAERLAAAQAQGASDEKIAELADQAKEGVKEGLSQAKDVLVKLSEYNERLDEQLAFISDSIHSMIDEMIEPVSGLVDVEDTDDADDAETENSNMTDSGADAVEATIVTESLPEVTPVALDSSSGTPLSAVNSGVEEPDVEVARTASTDSFENIPSTTDLNHLVYNSSLKIKQDNHLSLQIRTNDGDLVTITAKEKLRYRDGLHIQTGGAESSYFNLQQNQDLSFRSNLSFEVEGELDEDELAALEHLFSQVNELADQFYAGDLPAVMDGISQFELDSSEFSGMNLTLQTRQSMQMRETYHAMELPENDVTPPWSRGEQLHHELLDYLRGVTEQINNLNQDNRLPSLGSYVESLLPTAIVSHPQNPENSQA